MPYIDINGIAGVISINNPTFFSDTTSDPTYDYYFEASGPNVLRSALTGWVRYRSKKDGSEGSYARTGAIGTASDAYIHPGPTGSAYLTAQKYGEDA